MLERYKTTSLIIHCIITLGCLTWIFLLPFFQNMLYESSQEPLFQGVMERKPLFFKLSAEKQKMVLDNYQQLPIKDGKGYLSILKAEWRFPFLFIIIWSILSGITCIGLIFTLKPLFSFIYLLPLCLLSYGIFAYFYPTKPSATSLFPSQKTIMQKYSSHKVLPLHPHYFKELQKAWNNYLVVEWAKEIPAQDSKKFTAQVDEGLFAFNFKRLEKVVKKVGREDLVTNFFKVPSLLFILLSFGWNLFFTFSQIRGLKQLKTS